MTFTKTYHYLSVHLSHSPEFKQYDGYTNIPINEENPNKESLKVLVNEYTGYKPRSSNTFQSARAMKYTEVCKIDTGLESGYYVLSRSEPIQVA